MGTILEYIHAYAAKGQGRFHFIHEKEALESWTFDEILQISEGVAAQVKEQGNAGDRVLLLFPQRLLFVPAFLGTLHANRIAVPATPPGNARSTDRVRRIMHDCQPAMILSTPELKGYRFVKELAAEFGIPLLDVSAQDKQTFSPNRQIALDSTAFLQYTSGSTGDPKGVMVSHANIVANEELIRTKFKTSSEDRFMGWLPFYHDMGLIGNVLHPLYMGGEVWLMDPMTFLKYPHQWLEAISTYNITVSGGPNFAYDHCVEQIRELSPDIRLDAWRVAFNGAEKVRQSTLERFGERFGKAGFQENAWLPCYGMAETTLLISSPENTDLRVERGQVSCGEAAPNQLVVVKEGQECEEGQEGEIWVQGTSNALGYWGKKRESKAIFGAQLKGREGYFLRTGDLGFQLGGQLYITGRLKDLMIVRGRNIHPEDVEASLSGLEGLVANGAAAFSTEEEDHEKLVLVVEVRKRNGQSYGDVVHRIRERVAEEFELALDAIVLIRRGTLPRTSSGKVRRGTTRQRYWEQKLHVLEIGNSPLPRIQRTSPIQQVLESVLETPISDPHQSLYSYGLDSLKMVQFLTQLESHRQEALEIESLPQPLTLSTLETWLGERKKQESQEEIRQAPLSPFQAAIWKNYQLVPECSVYHVPVDLEMPQTLGVDQLKERLLELVRRVPLLRSHFVLENSQLRMETQADGELFVPDLEAIKVQTESGFQLARNRFFRSPFELDKYPLWRIARVEMPGKSPRLWLVFLHLLTDGVGIQHILRFLIRGEGRVGNHSYLDWSRRAIEHWGQERKAESRKYWQGLLTDHEPLQLPLGETSFSSSVGTLRRQVPKALWARIRAHAEQLETTSTVICLAAYALLIGRLAGTRDILIGVPVQLRTQPAEWELVGPLLNTVLVRVQVRPGAEFTELIQQIHQQLVEEAPQHRFPIDELLALLDPRDERQHFPLTGIFFNTVLSLDSQLSLFDFFPGMQGLASNFLLNFYLAPSKDRLEIRMDYREDVLNSALLDRLLAEMTEMLDMIVSDAPVLGLPGICNPNYWRKSEGGNWLAGIKNRIQDRYFSPGTILELLQDQSRRTPDRVALVQRSRRVSYGELEEKARELAGYLMESGVKKGDFAVLLMDKTLEVPLAFYAMMKLGAILVPMDIGWPPERIRELILELEPVFITYNEGGKALWNQLGLECPHYFLDFDAKIEHRGKESFPEIGPSDLVYGMYTSGTTGRPKCTLNYHLGLHNRFRHMDRRYGQSEEEVALFSSKYDYDAGLWQLFWPLCNGGKSILPKTYEEVDFETFCSLVREHQVTFLDFVPTVFDVFVDYLELHPERVAELQSLKQILIGGEYVNASSIRRFRELLPQVGFTNTYGATEASMGTVFFEIPAEVPDKIPIGQPIDHVLAVVLNEMMEPVERGEVGELYLGGDCVGAGYYKSPEKTAASFIRSPYKGLENGRWYRTGDLVRERENGNIEYIGRRDAQIKRGGVRIEPEEIEQVLLSHPKVQQAALVVAPSHNHLVAYLVGTEISFPELRSFLSGKLPAAMIPDGAAVLPSFPRISIGKVDKKALAKEPYAPFQLISKDASSAPVEYSGSEARLKVMLEDYFGFQLPPEFILNNYAAMGGNSLQALELTGRIESVFGIRLAPLKLLTAPSFRQLTQEIDQRIAASGQRWDFEGDTVNAASEQEIQNFLSHAYCAGWQVQANGEGGLSLLGLNSSLDARVEHFIQENAGAILASASSERPGRYLASYLQQAVWRFLIDRGNSNISFGVVLDQPMEVERLQRAFMQLLERHEALRTTFALEGDQLWQECLSPDQDHFRVLSMEAMPLAAARARCKELRNEVFDIFGAPLLKAYCFPLQEGGSLVFFVVSHLIFDGLSIPVFGRDLAAFYLNEGYKLPEMGSSYRDHIQSTAFAVENGLLAEARSYWERLAAQVPPFHPFRVEKDGVTEEVTYATLRDTVMITGEDFAAVEAFCHRARIFPSDFFLLLETLLIRHFSGNLKMLISSSVHNREDFERKDLVGLFTNSLFQLVEMEPVGNVVEWGAELVQETIRSREFNAYPHNLVWDEFFAPQGFQHHEIRRYKYNFIDLVSKDLVEMRARLGGETLELPPLPFSSNYLLLLVVREQGQYRLHVELNARFFDELGLGKIRNYLVETMKRICRQGIEDIETLTNFIDTDSNK